MSEPWAPGVGALFLGKGRCRFRVWAPNVSSMEVHLLEPADRVEPMEPRDCGYYERVLDDVRPGALYMYRLDGDSERPDPASRFQPRGVHGPSQVVDVRFDWGDEAWTGIPLEDYVLYELHVGTFTPEGTFEAIIPHLDGLRELGVTAVEIMPVAQFPGDRNWGYDGVLPYAVQDSYGGPQGLKRLVDACHQRGLAAVLDVVYNHLGPEGNRLHDFGPYFTDRYHTLWGAALNFDGPESDQVRRYFNDNALYWITEFHFDGLRLDAVDAIIDTTAKPLLRELAEAVRRRAEEMGRRVYTFAESALNDPRLIRPPEQGGYGLDGQWNDEFHHALHALLTGESDGYYQDFGRVRHLAKAFREGYVYSGEYSPFRRRRHGLSSRDIPATQFVVFRQNHDQVGNRVYGRRLSRLVPFEALKVAAAVVLLSPYVPLLFMGEEYGETAPFLYFVSHSDPDLIEAVRSGRQEEFAAFAWEEEPPDPQDERTFLRCKLDHGLQRQAPHDTLREFYGQLLRLRREVPALARLSKEDMEVRAYEEERSLIVRRWAGGSEALAAFNLGEDPAALDLAVTARPWRKLLDSVDERWNGPGSPAPERLILDDGARLELAAASVVLYEKESGA